MRSMKKLGTAVAAVSMALALVGASSASAATWDPQGTVVHGHGDLTLHSGSATVTCTVTVNTKATGDRATTTTSAGADAGPTFSNCSNNLGVSPTTVTSSSAWVITATSTTVADVTNGNAVISIGGGICTITASGVSVSGNGWSNATHTLTAAAGTFPIATSGFCPGTAATAFMSGSVVVPAATIT